MYKTLWGGKKSPGGLWTDSGIVEICIRFEAGTNDGEMAAD